jgi:DNA topoisomerase VI subunit B
MPAKTFRTPIVNEQRFILATRDTGYRSTAAAIAELVDNAIQAGSTIIRIFVNQAGAGPDREISIGVLDNGCGMTPGTLATAMQFAGSSRFDDRSGLGRFGMGLPNSSVSQARRFDVFTWRDRNKVLHSYLDVDQISDGELRTIPLPRRAELPAWAEKYVRKQTGTLVEWTRCDRVDNRKASTIADKLLRPLGQRFRYYLSEGNRILVNSPWCGSKSNALRRHLRR